MSNDHGASADRSKRIHIHSPVAALAFFCLSGVADASNFILSGEDTILKIRDMATSHLHAIVQVFPSQPIRGISSAPDEARVPGEILVWGGPWIAAIPSAKLVELIRLSRSQAANHIAVPELILSDADRLRAPDWIYHAALSPHHSNLAAVATAHNEVLPLHISSSPMKRLRWGAVRSPPSSRPILYAAQVRWLLLFDGAEEVLVAAGTAFGEIVVWRCKVGGDVNVVEVLYVFTGHEGSIFGVDISSKITGFGPERRFLASCSDDRTIRIWDISSETTGNTRRPLVVTAWNTVTGGMPEARETGFGDNMTPELEAHAKHVCSTPVAMAMGHVSRIWQARFALSPVLGSAGNSCLLLYSFGEDATAQRWRFGLPSVTSGSLNGEVVQMETSSLAYEAVIHRHSGKNIWSGAVFELSTPVCKTVVATGGSDGQINIVEEIPSTSEDELSVFFDLSGSAVVRRFAPHSNAKDTHNDSAEADDSATLQKKPKRKNGGDEDEPFLMYALLSATSIVASTATGRIFRGNINASSVSWKEIPLSQTIRDDLRQYQAVSTTRSGTAFFGSAGGQLYVYHRGSVKHVSKVPGKVADIFTLYAEDLQMLGYESEKVSSLLAVFVSTIGSSQVRLLVLDLSSLDSLIQHEFTVDLEKGFVVTAVGRCQEYLVLGSRSGALQLVRWTGNSMNTFEKVLRVDRPRAKDTVSSVISLPGKAKDIQCPYFLTTSRDGRYRIYEIIRHTAASSSEVHLRHEALPALGGPYLESALFTTNTSSAPELILIGFRGRNLVVWNETRQRVLVSIETGGAHRSTTWGLDQTRPESLTVIWNRPSRRTCIFAQTARHGRVIKSGGHGRKIKVVAASSEGLLATGAEDTTIRMWRRGGVEEDRTGERFKCLAVVERHTTGIQCLMWVGTDYLVSSAGNEELFVWRITRFPQSAYEGLAVMCEGTYPDKTKDGDLRIMGLDVQIHKLESHSTGLEEDSLCLSLVLSNSTLRTYRYSTTAGFVLLASGRYTGACLLQVCHLHVSPSELHVLTTSTDGHIALWRAATNEYTLVETCSLHQSSIKTLDLCALTQSCTSSYTVHTGGDDNALGHVRLDWDAAGGTAGQFRVAARALAHGAHAAAITGLCVRRVSPTVEGGYSVELVTVGNDQRVRSWQTRHEVGRGMMVSLALVADACSGVADCADLKFLVDNGSGEGREALIVGVGMELWMM